MSQDSEEKIFRDWLDFSVSGDSTASNASDLYESYKIYKRQINTLPKSELVKRGWMSSKDDIASFSHFFRDLHESKGTTLYRKSDTADASLISLWLSKVKSQAELETMVRSTPKFHGISKENLREIAKLSVNVDILPKLPSIMSELGITLVFVRALPSMKLDGAVFKLSSGNPAIGMSLRYSRLDNFWFTLLHELSHIQLHIERLDTPIIDDFDIEAESAIEISANRLAKQSFVERSVWRNCEPKYNRNLDAIDRFSNDIGVHRSIIAGMLRKEFGDYSAYSKIVNEHNTREIIFNEG